MERFAQMELSVFRDFISFILRGGSPLRVYCIPPLNCAVIKFLSPPDRSLRWPSFSSIAFMGMLRLKEVDSLIRDQKALAHSRLSDRTLARTAWHTEAWQL